MLLLVTLGLGLWAAQVSCHGSVIGNIRVVGPSYKAACGDTAYSLVSSDSYGNTEQLKQQAASKASADCNLDICKGLMLSDNKNVQTYTPGQTIPMKVEIRAPHTGTAKVVIFNPTTGAEIGAPLKSWDNYASTKTGVTKDQTDFSVTIPTGLSGCGQAGQCAIRWLWYSPEAKQTYDQCIDFILGGGGGSGNGAGAGGGGAAAANTPGTVQQGQDQGMQGQPNYGGTTNGGGGAAAANTPGTAQGQNQGMQGQPNYGGNMNGGQAQGQGTGSSSGPPSYNGNPQQQGGSGGGGGAGAGYGTQGGQPAGSGGQQGQQQQPQNYGQPQSNNGGQVQGQGTGSSGQPNYNGNPQQQGGGNSNGGQVQGQGTGSSGQPNYNGNPQQGGSATGQQGEQQQPQNNGKPQNNGNPQGNAMPGNKAPYGRRRARR